LERTCQSLDRRARKADVARRISQEVENILPFIFPTFPASSVTSFRSAESPLLSDGRPPLFLSVLDGGDEKTGINKPHARGVRFGDRVSRLSLNDRPPALADVDTLYRSSYPRRPSTLSSETPHCGIARRHVARARLFRLFLPVIPRPFHIFARAHHDAPSRRCEPPLRQKLPPSFVARDVDPLNPALATARVTSSS